MGDNKISVSVIIPNYNHAQFLDARIQSVLNQTYQNFEVIILDDKSTDNSVDVINKYSTNRHVSHVIVNDENTGIPFKQWHKGFDLAKGDLIWIAESDDLCDNTFLQTVVYQFEKHPECVLSFCRSVFINHKDEVQNTNYAQLNVESFYIDFKSFMQKYLGRFNFVINASSAVFKKKALKNIDNSYVNYHGCGDWLFWAEIAKSGKISYNNMGLNMYRIHDYNTSSLLGRNGTGDVETFQVYTQFKEKGYINPLYCIMLKLSLLMGIKYRKGFPDELIDKIISDCHYNKAYQIITTILHLMGRK